MTGNNILALTSNILGGETIDQTFGLQMLNVIRGYIEMRRPWQVLKKYDKTQTVTPANTYLTPLAIPADFRRYLGDGTIQLFDGNNDLQSVSEIPFEDLLDYRTDTQRFAADYGSLQFYLTGIIPKTYSVWQWYIFNPGDITASTAWLRFPAEYHALLAYELAAMWRMGIDYDDVNARNANDNAQRADMIYSGMVKWDTELALSSVRNLDYRNDKRDSVSNVITGPKGFRV